MDVRIIYVDIMTGKTVVNLGCLSPGQFVHLVEGDI